MPKAAVCGQRAHAIAAQKTDDAPSCRSRLRPAIWIGGPGVAIIGEKHRNKLIVEGEEFAI
jgi:hypothetical protein